MRAKILSVVAISLVLLSASVGFGQRMEGTLVFEVHTGKEPVSQAEVRIGNRTVMTDARGEAQLELPPGDVDVTLQRSGFVTQTLKATIVANTTIRLVIELQPEELNEEVTVTATRTDRRLEDIPLRVEVVGRDEIEEKLTMTPGDIAMLLNETSGLRVQVTSPSLGAANVRIQGLRGRYSQLLADGLPLYGGQSGALSLLQIPPMDLDQVEVIKGVASALYGSSALGGVINLVSRRPDQAEREVLFNRTSQRGTDGILWIAQPLKGRWQYTVLGGFHHQEQRDLDDDGWADIAHYKRGTARPRFFWDNGAGKSFFVTGSAMLEDREGGTVGNATVPDGNPFKEELRTRRFDVGLLTRFLTGNRVVTMRGSAMSQRHGHVFGPDIENDRHHTMFGEASISASSGRHTWALGSSLQADLYRNQDVPRFDYTYAIPSFFAQDDYSLGSRVTLSGSGRVDFHSDYGTFFNPRLSALLRPRQDVAIRLSTGTGSFAPTPFTEETEAVGLSRLLPLQNLDPERAWSASGDISYNRSFVELNGSIFGSVVRDPIALRVVNGGPTLELINSTEPIKTAGTEALARFRRGAFGITLTHTYIRSTELEPTQSARREVPLTPRHTASMIGSYEVEGRTRVVLEVFYTGRQELEDNPYRSQSDPYWIVGLSGDRRFGKVRLFINAENLTNIRQTRYNPLVRPQRSPEGRWTVDAWAPLEGRVINGGLRVNF